MNEKQKKLIELLKEMFQLNQTDLDFGIYRIMNQKADEINQFLEKDLISSIKNAFSSNNNDSLKKELDDLILSITNAGMNPEDSPKVKEIREKLASSSSSEQNENEIYSYMTNFFSRYYKDGDFVSLRRYKKDTYAIPYEGEEVKLHWANSDQYYIKTSEFFRDYTFKVKNKTYHFKIVEADTEKNNNKASDDNERRFVLDYDYPLYEENGELFIRFEYKAIGKELQRKLNEKAIEAILKEQNTLVENLKTLSPTEKNKDRTILEKHLTDYTSRNSFDYFIHKDLKGFLTRELDFYIKNEILYIDDILETSSSQIENALNKVKTFKTIAQKIIAFLSQLEEFQKKLWLKKKFVIDTNYCITLDKIDESFYQEIFDNKEQLKEWKELFKVEVKSIEDLKEEKFLVLDTKFFDDKFKNKLLSEFDDIDEECDGVLINSDNINALVSMQERYKNCIDLIYIDPPFNTGSDFLYKDNYQDSSWLTLMENRMQIAKELLSNRGSFYLHLDYNADYMGHNLLDNIFGKEYFRSSIIWKHTRAKSTGFKNYGVEHNTIYYYTKRDDYFWKMPFKDYEEDKFDRYYCNFEQNDGTFNKYSKKEMQNFRKTGEYPKGRPFALIPILNMNKNRKNLTFEFKGILETWATTFDELTRLDNEGMIVQTKEGAMPLKKQYYDQIEGIKVGTLWDDIYPINSQASERTKFDTQKPEKLMERIIKASTEENSLVMDYFSGSGSTINTAHKLKRKWLGVEMGEYFDSITINRTKNTLFGFKGGISESLGDDIKKGGMFKYFKLESYEDSLNNLAFKNVDKDLFDNDVKEDYLLNYMLDYETNESLLNIDAFKTPFDYKLKIASSSAGETVETNVDLVETFNYLIGLKVKTRVMNKGFLVIQGKNLKEEKILVIWRDGKSNDELNAFFSKMDFTVYDREFVTIYVNGDNNLANLKKDEDHFKVKLIEEEFKVRMFGE